MNPLAAQIRKEMKKYADPAVKEVAQRFFKEKISCYGVKSGMVRKIAQTYWKEARLLGKKDLFDLCEELYRSDFLEESSVASLWLPKLAGRFDPHDLAIFKGWIDSHIHNWAACDTFCNHTVGDFIEKYPESIRQIIAWTQSDNRWTKRAAAVSLILPARKGKHLDVVFRIADRLLTDPDDMVQKGYGWLLKEASRLHTKDVFDYVVKHRKTMPRTALRYAIELMTPKMKKEAMKKD
jgi:3-methyladenine DNA glycosylase AlkD